jgi:hypothetical protein
LGRTALSPRADAPNQSESIDQHKCRRDLSHLAEVINQGLQFGPFGGEEGFAVEGGGERIRLWSTCLSVADTGQPRGSGEPCADCTNRFDGVPPRHALSDVYPITLDDHRPLWRFDRRKPRSSVTACCWSCRILPSCSVSTGTGECAGPDELGDHVATVRRSSARVLITG